MTYTKKTSKIKMTKKRISSSRGGNINNQVGLDKILSIGYEVESTNLIKLTETQEFENTLYNSDSARKDMEEFKKLKDESTPTSKSSSESRSISSSNNSIASSISSIDADINERNEEQSTAKMYQFEKNKEPGTEYPDAVFNITNDISKPKFNRTLKTLCKNIVVPEGESILDIKNNLYKYKENSKKNTEEKEYNINFKFKQTTEQELYNFTNVEWVVTYYKPQQSKNIILDTFLNMIKNIVNHLDSFEPIPGQFIYTNPTTEEETVVPGKCMLYKSTNEETLYYLQTEQVINQQNSLDNICSKTQMTFSAKAEDIIDVMLKITTDYTGFSVNIPEIATNLEEKKNTIIKIRTCVDKLYDYFTISNILTKAEKNKLRNKKIQIKQLKTYMFLILIKINRFYYFMFYNTLVKTAKKRNYTYLKDLLSFNSRHTNYVLYNEIKEKIKEILELPGEAESKVIQIIKNLFLQPEILTEYLIEEDFKSEEFEGLIDTTTIFSKDFSIDKDTQSYGDPTFSLNSYFDFFEEPANNEKNKKQDGITIKYYDWLEYDGHDIFSANMDLKNDIVLLECRFFQDLLTSYFYHIGKETLKEQMTNGVCNKIKGKEGDPGNLSMSIANFKEIIELYGSMPSVKSDTRKSKSKSKSQKKKSKSKTNKSA
jgi:hypothetical protein